MKLIKITCFSVIKLNKMDLKPEILTPELAMWPAVLWSRAFQKDVSPVKRNLISCRSLSVSTSAVRTDSTEFNKHIWFWHVSEAKYFHNHRLYYITRTRFVRSVVIARIRFDTSVVILTTTFVRFVAITRSRFVRSAGPDYSDHIVITRTRFDISVVITRSRFVRSVFVTKSSFIRSVVIAKTIFARTVVFDLLEHVSLQRTNLSDQLSL